MRTFWIVILALAVVTALLLWRGSSARTPVRLAVADGMSATELPRASDNEIGASPKAVTEQPKISDADIAAMFTPPSAANDRPATASDAETLVDDLLESSSAMAGQDIGDVLDDGSIAAPHTATAAPVAPGAIDGTYILAGDGSMERPFEITWDLLILASQTYQPRLNKTDIPPQVKAVDGKRFKIMGYFAFPMASTDAREVLVMLNMWDGCCIGVPPSPYDAIEVRLKEPMANVRRQFANYGTLSGTLKVDPYVQNGWLLGMYLVEDGVIDASM